MTYRSDLEAAHARADAAERDVRALEQRVHELETRAPGREIVPRPRRFIATTEGDALRIRWRWFRASRELFLLAWTVVWLGPVGYILVDVASRGLAATGTSGRGLALLLLMAVLGIATAYRTVAGFVNSTTVTASGRALTVEHGPLPWGRKRVDRRELRQLYVREHARTRGTTIRTWYLCAVTTDGVECPLLAGLHDDEARYLEPAIEAHLGIADAPVVGAETP